MEPPRRVLLDNEAEGSASVRSRFTARFWRFPEVPLLTIPGEIASRG
jgi:hypothetical protein